MSQKRHRLIAKVGATGLGLSILSACAVVPGIDLTLNAEKDGAPTELGGYDLVKITPGVVREENSKKYPLVIDGREVVSSSPPKAESGEGIYSYKVGAGDVLSVIVWGHPELTSPTGEFRDPESAGRLVSTDGNIFYPYIGELKVAGKSTQEIRRLIANGLSRVVRDPQVDVRVASYRSKSVSVIGYVGTPSILPITDRPLTLLQALAAAGGIKEGASESSVLLKRAGQSYLIRVNTEKLDAVSHQESDSTDGYSVSGLELKNGDTVVALHPNSQKVYVLGATNSASTIPIVSGETSLAEALTGESGVNQLTANSNGIFVVRKQANSLDGTGERATVFQMKISDISDLLIAENFKLIHHDIVYVDRTGLASFNSVISQVLPTVSTIFQLDRVFLND